MDAAEGDVVVNGVKVFSASLAKDRNALGDVVTDWLQNNRNLEVYERQVLQSSDSEFHCVTIVLWWRKP